MVRALGPRSVRHTMQSTFCVSGASGEDHLIGMNDGVFPYATWYPGVFPQEDHPAGNSTASCPEVIVVPEDFSEQAHPEGSSSSNSAGKPLRTPRDPSAAAASADGSSTDGRRVRRRATI
jgi:hypothetical protein